MFDSSHWLIPKAAGHMNIFYNLVLHICSFFFVLMVCLDDGREPSEVILRIVGTLDPL